MFKSAIFNLYTVYKHKGQCETAYNRAKMLSTGFKVILAGTCGVGEPMPLDYTTQRVVCGTVSREI